MNVTQMILQNIAAQNAVRYMRSRLKNGKTAESKRQESGREKDETKIKDSVKG